MPIPRVGDNITFRALPELKAQFQAVADAEGRTMTVILTRFIEDYIQKSSNKPKRDEC
jgi:predicted transcriptional regulator